MAAASLRALLTRAIDYAGMFPPCSVELEPALKNQAEYVRAPDSWMLSAFVLPVAKFADAAKFISQFDKHHPLRVSIVSAQKASKCFVRRIDERALSEVSCQNDADAHHAGKSRF